MQARLSSVVRCPSSVLEPGLLAVHVCRDELLVRLGQIDDALDQADRTHDKATDAESQDGDEQHRDSGTCVTENELVNPERSEEDAQYARRKLL